jgi:hypothetical protein
MAIVKFSADNLEYFDLEVHHNRQYSSGSSISKITSGTLRVFPRGSKIEKMRGVEDIYTPFLDGALGTTTSGWAGQSGKQSDAKWYLGRTWWQVLKLKSEDKDKFVNGERLGEENGLTKQFGQADKTGNKGILGSINKSSANIKATKTVDIKRFRPTTNTRFLSSPGSSRMNSELEPSPSETMFTAWKYGLLGGKQKHTHQAPGITRRNKALKTFAKKTAFLNAQATYKMVYPDTNYGFSNYTCLNFLTGGMVPSDSVFIYPNIETRSVWDKTYASGCYTVYGDFTFDFHINPRYGFEKAGTIFHLSSSYALSLVTGSHKNNKNEASGFRLLLQLSHSADIPPSEAIYGTTQPNNLIFSSSNNALKRNHWHHVAVRWGNNTNNSTGSFIIDGEEKGTFVVPASTVSPSSDMTTGNPNCLYVGNYYEGTNLDGSSTDRFFNGNQAYWQGTIDMAGTGYTGNSSEDPTTYSFTHPLNAECHELKIYDRFIDDSEIGHNRKSGLNRSAFTKISLGKSGLLFYVPPFFTCDGPVKRSKPGIGYTPSLHPVHGGIRQGPNVDRRKILSHMNTTHPYNIWRSLDCEGLEVNLDNFVRDFVTDRTPRLQHLTSSRISFSPDNDITDDKSQWYLPWTTNELTYASQKSMVKRNLSVLPCDNGKFVPDFSLIDQDRFKISTSSLFFNRNNYKDLSFIDLTSPIFTGSQDSNNQPTGFQRSIAESKETGWYNDLITTQPSIYRIAPEVPSGVLPARLGRHDLKEEPPFDYRPVNLQRTGDVSSNEVTFFEISDLFYGSRIKEGTLTLVDNQITGSSPDNKVRITLKDNKYGGLYRADAETAHATWNTVGSVLYNEGVVAVTFPSLAMFGKEQHDIDFEGVNMMYVSRYNIPVNSNTINSSSNPSYKILHAEEEYVSGSEYFMITNINLHDENFNIIGRINLAQPVFKRPQDKMVFRPKMDF